MHLAIQLRWRALTLCDPSVTLRARWHCDVKPRRRSPRLQDSPRHPTRMRTNACLRPPTPEGDALVILLQYGLLYIAPLCCFFEFTQGERGGLRILKSAVSVSSLWTPTLLLVLEVVGVVLELVPDLCRVGPRRMPLEDVQSYWYAVVAWVGAGYLTSIYLEHHIAAARLRALDISRAPAVQGVERVHVGKVVEIFDLPDAPEWNERHVIVVGWSTEDSAFVVKPQHGGAPASRPVAPADPSALARDELLVRPPNLKPLLPKETFWLSTGYGGLLGFTGRWDSAAVEVVHQPSFMGWLTRSAPPASQVNELGWVHESGMWQLQRERIEGQLHQWVIATRDGSRQFLLCQSPGQRTPWTDSSVRNVRSSSGWHLVNNNAVAPMWRPSYPTLSLMNKLRQGMGELKAILQTTKSAPTASEGTTITIEVHRGWHGQAEYQRALVVHGVLDRAAAHGSAYFHGATWRDANRYLLGEYVLQPTLENEHPAYAKVGEDGTIRLVCDSSRNWRAFDVGTSTTPRRWRIHTDEPAEYPGLVRLGAWMMVVPVRGENGELEQDVPKIAPKLVCGMADDGHQVRWERSRKEFGVIEAKNERARELQAPGAVKVDISEIRAGDHIFYPTLLGAVYHHVIVTTQPNSQLEFWGIHFQGPCETTGDPGGLSRVAVHRDARFQSSNSVWVLDRSNYYEGIFGTKVVTRSPVEIVRVAERALDRQGCPLPEDPGNRFRTTDYDGVKNNCEHFCTYCSLGKRWCYQVHQTKWKVFGTAAKAASGAALGVAGVALAAPLASVGAVVAAGVGGSALLSGWSVKRLYDRGQDVSVAGGASNEGNAHDLAVAAVPRGGEMAEGAAAAQQTTGEASQHEANVSRLVDMGFAEELAVAALAAANGDVNAAGVSLVDHGVQHTSQIPLSAGQVEVRSGDAGAVGSHGRMAQSEAPLSIAPDTPWNQIRPQRSCADEMRSNASIRESVGQIGRILNDGLDKREEIRGHGSEEQRGLARPIDDNELLAIIMYTHDLRLPDDEEGNPVKAGNLYFELNNALRARDAASRRAMMNTWGPYVHYTLRGLGKLPDFAGLVYRGVPSRVESDYTITRSVKWTAFISCTTSLDAAKEFIGGSDDGVIFRITVTTGKVVTLLSLFPEEGEVLLWPGQRFVVTRAAYVEDGYTFVDLIERATDTLVF